MTDDRLLDECGESWLIDHVFAPRYQRDGTRRFGDDTAVVVEEISSQKGILVATVDPCPPPAAIELGHEDYYFWGWLAVVINMSDLAASGAQPVALLSSLELPASMKVDELNRLLDGMDAAAAASGAAIIGGNIKEADRLGITVTAIGSCNPRKLSRVGASKGDALLAVGPLGEFWAQFFDARDGLLAEPRGVLLPEPQIQAGLMLVRQPAVHCCADNSDGLATAVSHIAESNAMGAVIEVEHLEFSDNVARCAQRLGIPPLNLAVGWGDWNLVCAVAPSEVASVRERLSEAGIGSTRIGHLTAAPGLMLAKNGRTIAITPPRSERLTKDSWMTSGIRTYIESILNWDPWALR